MMTYVAFCYYLIYIAVVDFDFSVTAANSSGDASGAVDETSADNFIKFFGCLLNQELKDAQKCFQTALACVVELINLKHQLTELTQQITALQASGKKVGLL
jgi:hypothetical protein